MLHSFFFSVPFDLCMIPFLEYFAPYSLRCRRRANRFFLSGCFVCLLSRCCNFFIIGGKVSLY